MRFTAQILSAALLAGVAVSQTAPASQTVQPQPQQQSQPSKVQSGMDAVKKVLKNPFKPKDKTVAAQPAAKPQAATAKQAPVAAAKPQGTVAKSAVPAAKPGTPAANAKPAVASAKQTTPAKTNTAAKPNTPAAKQAAPVQAKAVPAAAKKPAVQAKTAPKKQPAKSVAAKVPAKPAAKPVEAAKPAAPAPAVAQTTAPKLPSPGKRDPFLSPIAAAAMRGPAANCSTGKHCLVVQQILLRGIVQTKEGNIAMVENAAKRSYYLHENDSLFDGAVVKITGDSVTFRQDSSDILGRPVSKEVVKKVSAPAV